MISEVPIPSPNSGPHGITTGPDGALWFTERDGNKIGRIDPTTRTLTNEYFLPSTATFAAEPTGITTGPNGTLWFTESALGRIGRIIIGKIGGFTTAAITEFRLPSAPDMPTPLEITMGPLNKLWFTEPALGRIGSISTTGRAFPF